MANKGDVLRGKDSSIEFVETTADSDGERVVVEVSYVGSGNRPPQHFHPSQDEHFTCLEGEVHAMLEGEERMLTPGDELSIPAGTKHEMWANTPSRLRWETSPAMKTERFFETFWGMQQDGLTGENGMPSAPQMALTLRRFSDEFRVASPPPIVQRIVFPVLALLGKARGLEPEYRPEAEAG